MLPPEEDTSATPWSLERSVPACKERDDLLLSWPSPVLFEARDSTDSASHKTQPMSAQATIPKQKRGPSTVDQDALRFDDEIRILELSSGRGDEALHGTLRKERLKHFADYEALSYTWADYEAGASSARHSSSSAIYLGVFWDILQITPNCAKALRRLRFPRRTRCIWVDSICIDQENESECTHQVKLMRSIYSNACTVLVYVGERSESSDLAMNLLRRPKLLDSLSTENTEKASAAISSLQSFFQRPYFSRMWIVQEVALAKSLYIHCGNLNVLFSPFAGSPLSSILRLSCVPAWLKFSRYKELLQGERLTGDHLFSLIIDTRACECSDPRDRLFALFGLIYTSHEEHLIAEYSLTIEQVYTGIAAFLAKKGFTKEILRLANRTESVASLPSWVPDWAHCWKSSNVSQYLPILQSQLKHQLSELSESRDDLGKLPLIPKITTRGFLSIKVIPLGHARHYDWKGNTLSFSVFKPLGSDDLGKVHAMGGEWANDRYGNGYGLDFPNKCLDMTFPVGLNPALSPQALANSLAVLLPEDDTVLILKPYKDFRAYSLAHTVGPMNLSSLCFLPVSQDETKCLNGVLSRPESYPRLQGGSWRKPFMEDLLGENRDASYPRRQGGRWRKLFMEDFLGENRDDSFRHRQGRISVKALMEESFAYGSFEYGHNILSLRDALFEDKYEKESRLWAEWLEMEPRGTEILHNHLQIESLGKTRRIFGNKGVSRGLGQISPCADDELTKFLCFFISYLSEEDTVPTISRPLLQHSFRPSSKYSIWRAIQCRTRHILNRTRTNEGLKGKDAQLADVKSFEYLKKWASITCTLLWSLNQHMAGTRGLDIPGEILLKSPLYTRVFSGDITNHMHSKFYKQPRMISVHLFQGSEFEQQLDVAKFDTEDEPWSLNKFKLLMEMRLQTWQYIISFIDRLQAETKGVDIGLLTRKVFTRSFFQISEARTEEFWIA